MLPAPGLIQPVGRKGHTPSLMIPGYRISPDVCWTILEFLCQLRASPGLQILNLTYLNFRGQLAPLPATKALLLPKANPRPSLPSLVLQVVLQRGLIQPWGVLQVVLQVVLQGVLLVQHPLPSLILILIQDPSLMLIKYPHHRQEGLQP